jgi:hypothetical protein
MSPSETGNLYAIACPNDPTPGRLRSREEEHHLTEREGIYACLTCKEYVVPVRVSGDQDRE